MTDPGELRAGAAPRLGGVAITRQDPPDGAVNRCFYTEVGRHHQWTDHLGRTDPDWQAGAPRVETWVASVSGNRAGYYELHTGADATEIAYFGLLPAFQGRGL